MVLGKRKRPMMTRRRVRRKLMPKRVPRAIAPAQTGIMRFKRKFYLSNFQPSTVAVGNFWVKLSYTLAQIQGFGDITALFDQYKINAFKLQLIPRFDSFSGENTTDTTLPGITNQSGTYVHVAYDPYSTTAPSGTYTSATLNTFMEQGRIKTYAGNRPINIYWKPTILGQYGNSYSDMYVPSRWLPTTQTGIAHWGPQIFYADNALNGTFGNSFDLYLTVYATVRNLK